MCGRASADAREACDVRLFWSGIASNIQQHRAIDLGRRREIEPKIIRQQQIPSMPPKRAKKNASSASDDAIPSFPAPPTTHTAPPEETHTPEQSPRKQAVGITQAQKQALIDNLQLESMQYRNAEQEATSDAHSQSPNARANYAHSMPSKRKRCDHGWRCASIASRRR